MALSGINQFLGMTGQEEIQYKVFKKFGLNDTEIRSWFNGPGTWPHSTCIAGASGAVLLFFFFFWLLSSVMLLTSQ